MQFLVERIALSIKKISEQLGLGAWRFFLAFLVAISHLWSGMLHGPAAYAVWGFYVLSGYLMTYVLIHKYGSTFAGLKDYAFNRFLRIFPNYWLVSILGFLTLVILPRYGVTPSKLNPAFIFPETFSDWIYNITLFPLIASGHYFVPVSGALSVEVGVYILIPLMAFSIQATWLGLILSLILNIHYGLNLDTFALRYSSFLTCFMAFCVGSLISHYRTTLIRFSAPFSSVLIWCLQCLIWYYYSYWPWTYGLYFSLLTSGWVILSFSGRKSGYLDTQLGDLSYPVYLLHTTVGVWFFGIFNEERPFLFFLLSFAITLALSYLLVKVVDRRLARIKKRRNLNSSVVNIGCGFV